MKKNSKLFLMGLIALLSFSLTLVLFISPAFAQYFTINKFHSDIMIDQDASVTVKETIEVEFQESRHGIYREIPFKYKDDLGNVFTTPIRVLSVRDGSEKPWEYQVTKTGPVIHVKIGDAKKYVEGHQTYVITYEIENVILYFKDHDELYWNVTGNAWKAPIEKASATVCLLSRKSENLMLAGYEGIQGSREECGYETYGELGKFYSKRGLNAGEGLTIAFGWDKGIVPPPSSWKKFLWAVNLGENWVFLLPVFSLAFMFGHWYQKGRDPKVRESVTVMYEPPQFDNKPLVPAEVGALIDENLDPRDITATIVGLAVKGYIKIEETKKEGLIFDSKDYYLKKVKGPDEQLTSFEKELMEDILPAYQPGASVSDLKNKFYTNLPRLKKMIYEDLVDKKYLFSNPEKVRNVYITGAFLVFFFLIAAMMLFMPGGGIKNYLISFITAIPIYAFGRVMPAKTRTGAMARMDILGFQEFMNRAEKDQLRRMGDKDLFSKFLPYAIALDVTDNWARAFEGIFQEPSDWYGSSGGFGTFTPNSFTHSFNAMTSSLGSAMYSSPRGSGGSGGGGGFSGGGFGGGGGGSW